VTRRLVLSYLAITVIVLVTLEVPLGIVVARGERDRLFTRIERDAHVLAASIDDVLEGHSAADPGAIAEEYAQQTGGRAVLVDAEGISLADSADPEGRPRDFSSRPEIADSLEGGTVVGERSSETLGSDLLYVSVPVLGDGGVLGAVRVTYPASEADERVRTVVVGLLLLAAAALVAVGLVGWFLATGVTGPLRRLRSAADSVGEGDFTTQVDEDLGPVELRSVARAFNSMTARLAALMGAQRALVADASHQLRTPLTALRLRLDALSSDDPDPQDLEAARDETLRLSRIVDGLLTLGRLDAGSLGIVTVDVDREVHDRVAMWTPLAEERGVTLSVRGRAEQARCVEEGLGQILDNLLANALDVSPDPSQVSVELSVDDAAGRARICVCDEGPGMTADERERAFDRFWRSPSAGPGGSGLGLSIVRDLAELSGGGAFLAEAQQGGVAAVVTLPRVAAGTASG
jgi:signal transduction histidine kinase